MAMGRQGDRQGDLMVMWSEMPRSPGHVFYDRLQEVLVGAGFDGFVEDTCRAFYAKTMGAPSVPPGRYFRMHMIGYFEGIDSERGIEWRCSDSLSLREFLRLEGRQRVPDHSWLSKTRGRLPHEVHEAVFGWVLALIARHGLIQGERIGVDASTLEANAALRAIVRRDTGEGYREMLTRMAQESGIETPTVEDLIRLDRNRKGKRLSNEEWVSETDPDARIARMKDGTTHLAYKPEHAVDLDTGAIHGRDRGGGNPRGRRGRHDDPVRHSGGGASKSRRAREGTDAGRASRVRRRQRIPFAHRAEDARSQRLDDADCRAAAQGVRAVARRQGGALGRLRQPDPPALEYRQGSHATAGRGGRTLLRPHAGAGRHAANLAAWSRECSQALPDPRCGAQSWADDAPPDRSRNAEGGCGPQPVGTFRPSDTLRCDNRRHGQRSRCAGPLRHPHRMDALISAASSSTGW